MANIKLKAILKAYSKTPFHTDYVRGVNILSDGQIQELEKDSLYGRRNGKWEKIFEGNMLEISDKLISLEKNDENIQSNFEQVKEQILTNLKNIDLKFDTLTDTFIYRDYLGNIHQWHVETPTDNDTLCYNDNNKLSMMYAPDGVTIKKTKDADTKKLISRVEGVYSSRYSVVDGNVVQINEVITGNDIANNRDSVRTELDLLNKRVDEIGNNGANDSYTISPVDLSFLYATSHDIDADIQKILSKKAIEELNIESGIVDSIPNGVNVVDKYKGDVWVFTNGLWVNKGNQNNSIVNANNFGISGVVTGVQWDSSDNEYSDEWENNPNYLKGHIDNDVIGKDDYGNDVHFVDADVPPTFSINGLKERLKDLDKTKIEIVYDQQTDLFTISNINTVNSDIDLINLIISSSPLGGSIVLRNTDGGLSINTNSIRGDDDVTTVAWFSNKMNELKNGVINLPITEYNESLINNDGDITTSIIYGV